MNAIERLKEAAYRTEFGVLHSTTPEIASMARSRCLENQVILNDLSQRGFVTQERLGEMARDKKLQNEYRKILVMGQNGEGDAVFATPELYAGWLHYFRRHYEWKWGLKLLSPEEEDITKLPTL